MIEKYKYREQDLFNAFLIAKEFADNDFYLTENNQRTAITDSYILKSFFKQCSDIYITDTDSKGFICVWKSKSETGERKYVRIVADNKETAKNLLTLILWHYPNELFVKLNKDSKFLNVYRNKGFKFSGDRGSQLLLKKDKRFIREYQPKEHLNVDKRNYNENPISSK